MTEQTIENRLRTGNLPTDNQFKSGQSGNPPGRPKGAKDGPTAKLRRKLRNVCPERYAQVIKAAGFDLSDDSASSAMMDVLIAKALEGSESAIKMVVEMVDGKPMQRQETAITGNLVCQSFADMVRGANGQGQPAVPGGAEQEDEGEGSDEEPKGQEQDHIAGKGAEHVED